MRRTPLIASINKEGGCRQSGGRCRSINVFVLPYVCYGRSPRTGSRSGPAGVPLSASPAPSTPRRKGSAARRRNFSIRFPSGALINCDQLLKRRNESAAAAHSSRAFLIGSRARCIFVHRRRRSLLVSFLLEEKEEEEDPACASRIWTLERTY